MIRIIRRSSLRLGVLLVATSLAACASTPKLTVDEVVAKNPEIGALQQSLRKAEAADAKVFAPVGYASASQKIDAALTAAREGNITGTRSAVASAGKAVDKMNQDMVETKDVLGEIITVRSRAEQAGAAAIYPERTEKLDKSLSETAALIERGKLEEAKKRRQELVDGYSKLELAALKEGVVEAAKATIKSAEADGAKEYAPKTFKAAKEEMALARSILDASRTDTEKANVHARRAKYLASQSAAMTELIKDMNRRGFDREDLVLWYQEQLEDIYEPTGDELRLDRANSEVVLEMKDAYAALIKERGELAAASSATEEQLQQKLELTEEQLLQKKKMEAAERQRFETAQSMFTPAEANVYRQRENVLISAQGFGFPSGQSEINTDNFVLLNKIVKVIGLFPGSTIEVSGHTDSTGSAELNLRLSKERAEKVAKFLNEVGGISEGRLSSEGFGKERPVASNETAEGRAENRRVEILIVNPSNP